MLDRLLNWVWVRSALVRRLEAARWERHRARNRGPEPRVAWARDGKLDVHGTVWDQAAESARVYWRSNWGR